LFSRVVAGRIGPHKKIFGITGVAELFTSWMSFMLPNWQYVGVLKAMTNHPLALSFLVHQLSPELRDARLSVVALHGS